jgi:hypothetical protein
MIRFRRSVWPVVFGFAMLAGVTAAGALELVDEPLQVTEERSLAQDESAAESVGEPAAEDAHVEGEPGPGDAVAVPPEEPADAGDGAPLDGGQDVDKPAE